MYKNSTSVVWDIILLYGNGNVFVLSAGVDSIKPRLQGPLTISPSDYSNYGDKFCSILVLPSCPPTLVMAQNSGRLHHGLLLKLDEELDVSGHDLDNSLQIFPNEWEVNILEIVELELGLNEHKKDNDVTKCPIYLKADLLKNYRYFAYHDMGLHSVTVNFIKELQNYVDSEGLLMVN